MQKSWLIVYISIHKRTESHRLSLHYLLSRQKIGNEQTENDSLKNYKGIMDTYLRTCIMKNEKWHKIVKQVCEVVDVQCKATQAVGLFPSLSPEIMVVRDVRLEDYWEVADTHCSSFFPSYRFPWDLLLRINRFLSLAFGLSVPSGCNRTILVAVTCYELKDEDDIYLGKIKTKGLEGNHLAGILTLDTSANFLPRKGRSRRTGIAYISNVAVREAQRRRNCQRAGGGGGGQSVELGLPFCRFALRRQ